MTPSSTLTTTLNPDSQITEDPERYHISASGVLGGEIDEETQFWKTRRSRCQKQMIRAMNPNVNEAIVHRHLENQHNPDITNLAKHHRKRSAVQRALHAGKVGHWIDATSRYEQNDDGGDIRAHTAYDAAARLHDSNRLTHLDDRHENDKLQVTFAHFLGD